MKSPLSPTERLTAWAVTATCWLTASLERGARRARSDRGDVPGWVMITMMTAIVVIVLLGVFQEAVVNAVKNAFDSISGQGGQP